MPPEFPAPILLPPETPRITLCLGAPGGGKTTIAKMLHNFAPRSLVIDSQASIWGGEYPGAILKTFAELRRRLFVLYSKAGGPPPFRLVYHGEVTEELWNLLALVPSYSLVVEEADLYGDASRAPDGLYRMAHYGRRGGQSLVLVSRRPASIARDLTCTAEAIYAFRMLEPRDAEYLRARGAPDVALEKHGSARWFGGEAWYVCDGNSAPHLGKHPASHDDKFPGCCREIVRNSLDSPEGSG